MDTVRYEGADNSEAMAAGRADGRLRTVSPTLRHARAPARPGWTPLRAVRCAPHSLRIPPASRRCYRAADLGAGRAAAAAWTAATRQPEPLISPCLARVAACAPCITHYEYNVVYNIVCRPMQLEPWFSLFTCHGCGSSAPVGPLWWRWGSPSRRRPTCRTRAHQLPVLLLMFILGLLDRSQLAQRL